MTATILRLVDGPHTEECLAQLNQNIPGQALIRWCLPTCNAEVMLRPEVPSDTDPIFCHEFNIGMPDPYVSTQQAAGQSGLEDWTRLHGTSEFSTQITVYDQIQREVVVVPASTAGGTWTPIEVNQPPNVVPRYSVAYGDKFLAVGGSTWASSVSGTSWSSGTLPLSGTNSVTYGKGLFVAVGGNTQQVAVSSTGSTWTTYNLPRLADWRDVTYGNGVFVAVAAGSDKGARSVDGMSWTEFTLPAASPSDWVSVVYGGDRFYAVTRSLTAVAASSVDGRLWTSTPAPIPSGISYNNIGYGKGALVAVGQGTKFAVSIDGGASWSTVTVPDGYWYGIASSPDLIVVTGFNDVFLTSENAIQWASENVGISQQWLGIAASPKNFLAVGNYSSKGVISGARNLPITYDYSGPERVVRNRHNWADLLRAKCAPHKRPYLYVKLDGWAQERRALLRPNPLSYVVGSKTTVKGLQISLQFSIPKGELEAVDAVRREFYLSEKVEGLFFDPYQTGVAADISAEGLTAGGLEVENYLVNQVDKEGISDGGIYFPAAAATNTATVVNFGTSYVPPCIKLYGRIVDPVITITPLDVEDPEAETGILAFKGLTVPDQVFVEIDVEQRTVRLQGEENSSVYHKLDWVRSKWPSMAPGENVITLTSADQNFKSCLIVEFRPRWI